MTETEVITEVRRRLEECITANPECKDTLCREVKAVCTDLMRRAPMMPQNVELPMFAYGLFKPKELGLIRLRPYVKKVKSSCLITGSLRERDGLPILDIGGLGEVDGTLLFFKEPDARKAYEQVAEIEPHEQYQWAIKQVSVQNINCEANVLIGRKPARGSGIVEDNKWDGKDRFFDSASAFVF